MSEVKKPETNLEKNACADAKKAEIERLTEQKKSEYQKEMHQFIRMEKEARSYRKIADDLKDILGVTDDEMKELFE